MVYAQKSLRIEDPKLRATPLLLQKGAAAF